MKERNVAVCIILSLVTCGIYGIYWFIVLTNDVNQLSSSDDTSGGVAFLLTLITCGIYGFYWAYQLGSKIDTIKTKQGNPSSNTSILYLILFICQLGIVAYALAQNEINHAITEQ